ncbi:MAG: Ig-like domain-containing protein [Acidobacteriota bacterium]
MKSRTPRIASWLLGVVLPALSSCSGGGTSSGTSNPPSPPPPPAPTLSSITVSAASSSVAAGLTDQFKATGTYSDSSTSDITGSVTWTSATTSVASINASGLATSKAQGTSLITATSGTVTASATLTVNPAALVSVSVNPASLQLGDSVQLKATGTYTDQSTQDLSGSATWTSSNAYVATIDSTGTVTTLSAGSSTASATVSGIAATADVAVFASPRYLYVAADAARTLTRMAVDGTSGEPRFLGYSSTNLTNSIGFPCLTLDPSGAHAYLSTQVRASSGSGDAGAVVVFNIDPSSGAMTALPTGPLSFSFPLGCLAFDPSGKFAYATSGIEDAGDQLGIFTVNSDATLTLNNTISYPFFPTGVAVDPAGGFLYVNVVDVASGTNGSSQLYGYGINASNGSLTPIQGSPWALNNGLYGLLAFHPTGAYLYASDSNATTITQFAINPDLGIPTKVGTVDSTCINPSALQFLPDGSHGYVLCGESGSRSVTAAPIVAFSADAQGKLTATSTAYAGPTARQMQADDAGKFLYVLGSGSDAAATSGGATAATNMVLAYQVQSDGSLKLTKQLAGHVQANSMALVSGPKPLKWTTTHAYVASMGDKKVTPYTVAANGTLTAGTSLSISAAPLAGSMLSWGSDLLLAVSSVAPNLRAYDPSGASLSSGSQFGVGGSVNGIAIDPSGLRAYATDATSNTVDVYARSSPGVWTALLTGTGAPFTYTAGTGPGPIATDPSGRYLVVGNLTDKTLSLIEPQGAAPTPNMALGYIPQALAFDPTGNFLFIVGSDNELHMLLSNGLGTLTEVATAPYLGGVAPTITIDPTSSFVYVSATAGIQAYAADINKKTLTPITLQIPVSLAGANGVYLDPTGSFLYVTVTNGSTTNAMYLFTVNSDGTLTETNGNPVAAPDDASSVLFSASVQ